MEISPEAVAFTQFVSTAWPMHSINREFASRCTKLFNNMSEQERAQYSDIYRLTMSKLELRTTSSCVVRSDVHYLPRHILHTTNTAVPSIPFITAQKIQRSLIDCLQFYVGTPPKRLFLLFGLDKSGFSTVAEYMYHTLLPFKSNLIHLVGNAKLWADNFNYGERQEQYKFLIEYLTCMLQNDGWILLELEHFESIVGDDIGAFLDDLLKLERVVLIATTSHPSSSSSFFNQRSTDATELFLDLPDAQLIGQVLQEQLFAIIHSHPNPNINNSASPYLSIASEFSELLRDTIAPRLTCLQNAQIFANVRECSSTAITKYGIKLSTLTLDLIPRLKRHLKNAHKNGYNQKKECMYVKPKESLVCGGNESSILSKETMNALDTGSRLNTQQVVSLQKGKISCHQVNNADMCSETKDFDHIHWDWIQNAKETVFEIAQRVLTDVSASDEFNLHYEQLVEHYKTICDDK